jgi:Nif-specific regulatory protein
MAAVPAALWLAGGPFDEGHLRLVSAVAAISGPAIQAVLRFEELQAENRRMQRELGLDHDMVGESPRMQEIYRVMARAAPTSATILITGESGTGKELVARAIHRNSPRARYAFVAINCAALTETLLESELFGHEKGAFTGAVAQKKGKIEMAEGGTLFLDELGEMPLTLQAKLLRVLQEREFERVGGTKTIKVDIRVVAATNRELDDEVKAGRFRQDLYYRLNVVTFRMPPLRERREDIPLLASFFVSRFSRQLGRRVDGISPEARGALLRYDWPGNVRELENAMERAVLLGSGSQILPEDCPEAVGDVMPAAESGDFHQAVIALKKRLIIEALDRSSGRITDAAKALGLHPNYLHRLMRNLELRG